MMDGRVGRGVITLFLCLVFISALLFVFLENKRISEAESILSPDYPLLLEKADPKAFIGPMKDYDYDLYAMSPDGDTRYIPPSAMRYAEPGSVDPETLQEFMVRAQEIEPASRETGITLIINGIPSDPRWPNTILANVKAGDALGVLYGITPATKTVILEGGGGTASVEVLPSAVDAYVAVRTPSRQLLFITAFSFTSQQFYTEPAAYAINSPIPVVAPSPGLLFGTFLKGNMAPGIYTLFAVMVPPGMNPLDQNNWISNLAQGKIQFGIQPWPF